MYDTLIKLMVKDFIVFGMRFKKNGDNMIRISGGAVFDSWYITDHNKDIKEIVIERMLENHYLYKDILKTL